MTDLVSVSEGGRLEVSALLKWVSAVCGTLLAAAIIGLFVTMQEHNELLGRIDERMASTETRLVRVENALLAVTRSQYSDTDAERAQSLVDDRLNLMSSRVSSLELRLYEMQRQ